MVDTVSSISARIIVTVIMVVFTVVSCGSARAATLVPIDVFAACATVLARIRGTLVDFFFAHVTGVASVAFAQEGTDLVDTVAVRAYDTLTIIDVILAVLACPTYINIK